MPRNLRLALFVLALLLAATAVAQQFELGLYSGMRWRLIGPFRAGRSVAVAGVPSQPNVFYFGGVGGGVWKTENAGESWEPIFDSQPVSSIGAVAVAASNPDVIYVGSGEPDMRSDIICDGNGVYKSTDGGKTWRNIGLRDTRQIGRVLIDPRNPDVVFVAALGHAYGPNAERGLFRSIDGGTTWQKVLYKDENTGAIDLAWHPDDPKTMYASLWQTRRPPWNVYPPSNGPGSGLYKSIDSGSTWRPVTGNGFPAEGLGRIGLAVAPTEPRRAYAIVDAREGGLYRSDDAGETWQRMNSESRIWGRGWYFGRVAVDPKDANTVYVMNTSTYRSRDGGKTVEAIKGAPGGDDYHQLWINPNDPTRMVMATDQGVIVSVDGARSWSSWYNQPTAQVYHVATDNAFPYRIYSAQQDSGAIAVPSRTNWANISFRDWYPACAGGESGSIAPDPVNANILYGGTVTRCDQAVNAGKNISPTVSLQGPFRSVWTLPLVFSLKDPKALYFSHQVLFKTTDGGQKWEQISPDLTRENPGVPANLDPITAQDTAVREPRRGVIYAIAPSPVEAERIWVGTDDGLIHVTIDGGKSWRDVTPKEITAWSKIGIIEASHFEAQTAYAAVDRHRIEDQRPYVYRTRDNGRTWKNVVTGLPDDAFVNVVREDPKRKGLLFAGTERAVWVSFDDGDHWQSLKLNLPSASMRDLTIHDDDLIVGTHGRSIWVLDDITPLRGLTTEVAAAAAILYQPTTAYRIQGGSFDGTPLPLGSPVGENPPNGAMISYYLRAAPADPVTLEVFDANNRLVRRYSSAEKPPPVDPRTVDIPAAWLRTPPALDASAGMHRFVWDLHWAAPAGAIGGRAGRGGGSGQWALPGRYTVKLTAAGQSYSQPLTVKLDPRVKATTADIEKQFAASQQAVGIVTQAAQARQEAGQLRQQLQAARAKVAGAAGSAAATAAPGSAGVSPAGSVASAIEALDRKLGALVGAGGGGRGGSRGGGAGGGAPEDAADQSSLQYVTRMAASAQSSIESAPEAPTGGDLAALQKAQHALDLALRNLNAVKSTDLPQLNTLLRQNKLPVIE